MQSTRLGIWQLDDRFKTAQPTVVWQIQIPLIAIWYMPDVYHKTMIYEKLEGVDANAYVNG